MTTDDQLEAAFVREISNQPRIALIVQCPGREDDALALSPEAVWSLIGQLHLALRHPQNTGASRQKVEAFLQWIRMMLVPPNSARDEVFRRGNDPTFDVDVTR